MSHPPDNEPLSLHDLRLVIRYRRGWKSLKNKLQTREMVTGQRIIDRSRGKTGLTRYEVTIARLREVAPDLLPSELREGAKAPAEKMNVRSMRRALEVIDDRIEDVCIEVIERRVIPRLEKVEKKTSQLKLPGIAT